jgi:hypothetical protein
MVLAHGIHGGKKVIDKDVYYVRLILTRAKGRFTVGSLRWHVVLAHDIHVKEDYLSDLLSPL